MIQVVEDLVLVVVRVEEGIDELVSLTLVHCLPFVAQVDHPLQLLEGGTVTATTAHCADRCRRRRW